jgi:hypothetical protein
LRQINLSANRAAAKVRYWHKADMAELPINVRFWSKSGHHAHMRVAYFESRIVTFESRIVTRHRQPRADAVP